MSVTEPVREPIQAMGSRSSLRSSAFHLPIPLRIAVVGDAILDVHLRRRSNLSPEAPVPVVRVRERGNALDGAANVAQNVAAIGSNCDLGAAIGDDAGGRDAQGQ